MVFWDVFQCCAPCISACDVVLGAAFVLASLVLVVGFICMRCIDSCIWFPSIISLDLGSRIFLCFVAQAWLARYQTIVFQIDPPMGTYLVSLGIFVGWCQLHVCTVRY